MTFPLINKVYSYKGQEVSVWQQDLFIKVYGCVYANDDQNVGSKFEVYNWWDFMFNAKYIKDAPQLSSAY